MCTKHTEDIMAIKKEKKAPQVPEIPEVSTFKDDYKKDLQEIKDLLKEICVQLSKLDYKGGF